MMRNVAIGAVLGFGAVVLLLSVLNNEAPPPAPPPAVAGGSEIVDGGVIPLNVAPVIVMPPLQQQPSLGQPAQNQPMAVDNMRRNAVIREMLNQHRDLAEATDAPDAAVP